MYICDECMSKLVCAGKARPHFEVYGNGTRWVKCECYVCKQERECVGRYDIVHVEEASTTMTTETPTTVPTAFTTCKRCGATHPRGTRCVLCVDAKPPRPKRTKAKSFATPRGRVKNALRLLSLRCRERAEAMKRAGYACGRCGAKQSKAAGREVRVEAHHCDPIAAENAMNRIIDMVFEYVLVPPERWEIMCSECHAKEHAKEVPNG